MNAWVVGCRRLCRGLSRAYPHEFRAICGDGLERLAEDVGPIVWREQGVSGLVRLAADVVLHLPVEYIRSWINQLKEVTMTGDLFEGTWKSEKGKDQFDTSYTAGAPEQACLRIEATDTGYLLVACGIKDGQAVAERPQPIITDGRRRAIVDMNGRPIPGVPPGAVAFGSQPDSHTLEGWAEAGGRILGGGTWKVSEDGKTLTATMEGMGLKGPFKSVAVFRRIEPDPYTPGA
jgi:hypothetical protein